MPKAFFRIKGNDEMKRIRQKLFVVILTLVLVFSGTIVWEEGKTAAAAEKGEMAVHFLDVGQGLSILVQSGGQNLLYDGGDRSASSFVVSYLKNQKVASIDYLISSHYDEDHVSGLIGCLNSFEVDNVIGADYIHDSGLYDSFMSSVEAKGLTVQHPAVGTEISFGTGEFTVLSPSEISRDSNNNSVAIKVTNGENSFIFTGDAEYESEENMTASGIDLSCDVLCLGHHGSASSTSWDFLQAAVPEYAVISCGTGNQYGHPHADTMEKLEAMEIEVFRTDKQGTVTALSDGTNISWNVAPCNDYTPGDESDSGTQPEGESRDFGFQSWDGMGEETAGSSISEQSEEEMVWLSATGSKYHSIPDCGNMNPDTARQVPVSQAEGQGYEACKKCW